MNTTIIKEQLISSFKSIKSIILILILSLISYTVTISANKIPLMSTNSSQITVSNTIFSLLSILGVFFTLQIFGGNLTKEIDSQSIRYILPYVNRWKIIISKVISYQLYWTIILIIPLLTVSIVKQQLFFPITDLISMLAFFLYINSVALLTSVIAKNEKSSTFIGIVISITVVFIGLWSIISNNIILKIASWLLPFRYITFSWEIVILLAISAGIITMSIIIFNKKEL